MKGKLFLSLHLFDAGTGSAAPAGNSAGNGQGTNAPAGKAAASASAPGQANNYEGEPEVQTQQHAVANTEAERAAEFDQLIKGDYRNEFTKRVQHIINDRVKAAKQLETRAKAVDPVLQELAMRYNVDVNDAEGMLKAVRSDSSYIDEEAERRGFTREQYEYVRDIETKNRQYEQAKATEEQQRHNEELAASWFEQEQQLKQEFPDFDFRTEYEAPTDAGERFRAQVQIGIPVREAYLANHVNDIMSGVAQRIAHDVSNKTAKDVRTRSMHPQEGALSGNGVPGQVMLTDMHRALTLNKVNEINQRVARGEKIGPNELKQLIGV